MKTALTLMAFLVALLPAYAGGWEQTSGPEGGNVRVLAAGDSVLLAVVEPGVIYRREASGWRKVATLDVRDIKWGGGIFMARTLDRFYRSIDHGATWEEIGPAGDEPQLAADGGTIYAARDNVVYRLSEEGGAWTQIAAADKYFLNFFASDSIVLLGRSGRSPGLYRSDDRGAAWEKIVAGLPSGVIPIAFHRIGSAIYMSTDADGVFRSVDGGKSWIAFSDGLELAGALPIITGFASDGGRLWASSYDGVYLLMDGKWYVRTKAHSRAITASGGDIYIGSTNRIYLTGGTGEPFVQVTEGLKAQKIDAMGTFGNSVIASANGIIYQSTDAGESWLPFWNRPDDIRASRFAGGDDMLYALDNHPSSSGIYRSEDGRAWDETSGQGLPYMGRYLSTLAVAGDTVFTAYYRTTEDEGGVSWVNGGVYRSVDGGDHWRAVCNGLPRRGDIDVPVYDLAVVRGAVLAQTMEGLYRSVDGGESWALVNTVLERDVKMRRFAVAGEKVYLAGLGGVFASADGGITWWGLNEGLPAALPVQYISAVGDVLYAATTYDGGELGNHTYRFDGEKWNDIGAEFPAGVTPRFFVKTGDRVLAGTTWNSIWRGEAAPSSVDRPGAPASGGIALTVSPNPFRSGMTAGFTLSKNGPVRLMLLSITGEEVGTVHDGVLESGVYEIVINGEGLASGAYYLRIETPDGTRTTTVIKVR